MSDTMLVWSKIEQVAREVTERASDLDGSGRVWVYVETDHGVTFGLADGNAVRFADPTRNWLDPAYLLAVRAFGSRGEWRVARAGDGFVPSLVMDVPDAGESTIDESWSLWGTLGVPSADPAFTVVSEDRGARFAVPTSAANGGLPVRLAVRHYVRTDPDTHMAYVANSRLLSLGPETKGCPVCH